MKIYKIKVNGKTYRVELESVEETASEAVKEVSRSKVEIICNVMEDKTMDDKIIVTLLASKFGNYMD